MSDLETKKRDAKPDEKLAATRLLPGMAVIALCVSFGEPAIRSAAKPKKANAPPTA